MYCLSRFGNAEDGGGGQRNKAEPRCERRSTEVESGRKDRGERNGDGKIALGLAYGAIYLAVKFQSLEWCLEKWTGIGQVRARACYVVLDDWTRSESRRDESRQSTQVGRKYSRLGPEPGSGGRRGMWGSTQSLFSRGENGQVWDDGPSFDLAWTRCRTNKSEIARDGEMWGALSRVLPCTW